MNVKFSHTPTYYFESYGPGLQDAFVYYHREMTPKELKVVSAILSPLLYRKHRGATEQLFLASKGFASAMRFLKKQISL
jgi:hypothetical protein